MVTKLNIIVRADLDPEQWQWSEEQTYSPNFSIHGYGFSNPEEAFNNAKLRVSEHYGNPDELEFSMEIK